MQPLVSVVIPVRNRESLIEGSLQSVLSQTYPFLEVVIVDDFSNDNTISKIRNFNDPRIKLISLLCQSGAQKARNIGISHASGDWIAFHDSDDVWFSDKLEKQMRILEKFEFSKNIVVHGNCLVYDSRTGSRQAIIVPKTEGKNSHKLLLTRPSPFFPCMLTSKFALMEIGLLDEKVPSYQEWDTAINLSKKCTFIHLDDILFTYVQHNGPTISRSMFKDFLGYQYVIKKYQSEIIELCGITVFERHLMNQLKKFFSYKIYEKDWKNYSCAYSFFDDIATYCSKSHFCLDDVPTLELFKKMFKNVLLSIMRKLFI